MKKAKTFEEIQKPLKESKIFEAKQKYLKKSKKIIWRKTQIDE